MLRKFCITFLAFVMIFVISASGASGEPSENEQTEGSEISKALTGGWELFDNEANALPEDVQTAFDKATETV